MAIANWNILSSRYSFKDKWLTVRTDICQTDCGRIIEDYHVLEYPDWVNIVPITSTGNILLVREYRHGAKKEMVGLPAGTMEKSDISPLLAAQRELEEETGYIAKEFIHLGSFYANPANQQNRVHSFLALDVLSTKPTHFDPNEQIETLEKNLTEFLTLLKSGKLDIQGLHLAALYLAEIHLSQSKI
jgi:8-oxo-dGTP pyrophosphatase MutT (NUDIX family)